MENSKGFDKAVFKEQVERARRMTPSERVAEGFRLYESMCETVKTEFRQQHPEATEHEVMAHLREHLRRLKGDQSHIIPLSNPDDPTREGWIVADAPLIYENSKN